MVRDLVSNVSELSNFQANVRALGKARTLLLFLVADSEALQVHNSVTIAIGDSSSLMKSLHFDVTIHGSTNPDKALLLAKKASESGFILNSVKTELSFSFKADATSL